MHKISPCSKEFIIQEADVEVAKKSERMAVLGLHISCILKNQEQNPEAENHGKKRDGAINTDISAQQSLEHLVSNETENRVSAPPQS